MLSVLRQPRWALLALAIIGISLLFVGLGRWQWHRHEDRRAREIAVNTAFQEPPVPTSALLKPGIAHAGAEYRTVTMTGSYDADHQLLWRNPRGRAGFSVLTPLVPGEGPALLVERGWIAFSSSDPGTPASDVTPPSGTVQVTARWRVDQGPDDRVAPSGQVYAVNSAQVQPGLPYAIYPGYGELLSQQPPSESGLELPETDTPGLGPHLLYAYQWWFFAVLAVVGFGLLLRREAEDQSDDPAGRATSTANDMQT